jgi:hypothetical protein
MNGFKELWKVPMNDSIYISIVSNLVTFLVAIGGWIFSYFVLRDSKRLLRLERSIEKYKNEIRARIYEENIACNLIAELDCTPAQTIKKNLRDRTESEFGIRPNMKPSDLI